jgi:hypothetical protein
MKTFEKKDLDQLENKNIFIKLCKSLDPLDSVKKHYQEHYLMENNDDEVVKALIAIISGVIDEHIPFRLSSFLRDIDPSSIMNTGLNQNEIILKSLISIIRFCSIDEIR